jgi:hypothetical protein
MFCWPCVSVYSCNQNQLGAQFVLSIFLNLCRFRATVPIIRRNNCAFATLCTCYSVWMTVWYASCVCRVHTRRKVPFILVRFWWNFDCVDRFWKILKFHISWKSVKWEPSYSMRTDGRTDMTKLIVAFRNTGLKIPTLVHAITNKTLFNDS